MKPHTIDNGAGERLTFVAVRRDERGENQSPLHQGRCTGSGNAGEDELVCSGYVRPPGNLEYFLTEVYGSMRRKGRDRRGLFDGAYLGHRYRSEFAMTEVPAPVRRLVFPVIAAVGRLLGLHRRFAERTRAD